MGKDLVDRFQQLVSPRLAVRPAGEKQQVGATGLGSARCAYWSILVLELPRFSMSYEGYMFIWGSETWLLIIHIMDYMSCRFSFFPPV